MIRIPRLC